jgi:hypothetical protein
MPSSNPTLNDFYNIDPIYNYNLEHKETEVEYQGYGKKSNTTTEMNSINNININIDSWNFLESVNKSNTIKELTIIDIPTNYEKEGPHSWMEFTYEKISFNVSYNNHISLDSNWGIGDIIIKYNYTDSDDYGNQYIIEDTLIIPNVVRNNTSFDTKYYAYTKKFNTWINEKGNDKRMTLYNYLTVES